MAHDITDPAPPTRRLLYGVDDVPRPFPKALGLSLQHVLTMFGATVAVPLLLREPLGFDDAQTAKFISCVFICSGLATLLQTTVGSRLPIVQGVSFTFLPALFSIIAGSSGGEVSMQYVAGAILAGSLVSIAIGYLGVVGKIQRFVTPVVIAPTMVLIGVNLAGAASEESAKNWFIASIVIVAVLVCTLILSPWKRAFSLFPILLSVLVAYVAAMVFSYLGVIGEGNPAYLTFVTIGDSVAESPWIRSPEGLLFPWGAPRFNAGFIITIVIAYIVLTIESLGDIHGISRAAGRGNPSRQELNRGIGAEGLGCAVTGLFGGVASSSYAENVGLVGLTRVASRYVVMLGAVVLIVLGFFAKFAAAVATIPSPIVGGLYMVTFGIIASIGFSTMQRVDLNSQRTLTIMGFAILAGLSVAGYFETVVDPDFGPEWLTNAVMGVGGSAMAVGAFAALLLDNVVPGTDAERGIENLADGEPIIP
ncbi:purine/pyrimidine permease [Nocardioides carbamazepini]|uniref:uracil-xanthine permease family protein n=1 Tax=Nocardioides carbamazepini TaxID=2854259 RepID=UPI00214A1E4B|nr:solute carrier family 23 protein [Nocardioides carbamazepini]MCR1786093.1 purine/pyrimidine permease [Nocardioides carbamazepini]